MALDRIRRAIADDLNRGRAERDAYRAEVAEAQLRAITQQANMTLDEAAALKVQQGWRIESHLPTQIVLVAGHRTNHVLHLLLSIVTLGLWLIVWVIVAATGGEKRLALTYGPDGRVVEQKI